MTRCNADFIGAVLVGPGISENVPVLQQAPVWDALDFAALDCDLLVLAESPSANMGRMLLNKAAAAGKRVSIIEGDLVRPMALHDIVGRALGPVDWARIRALIADRTVLITGGGGSIGAELARRVSTLGARRLVVVDCSEFNLFRLSLELPGAVIELADVRNGEAMRRLMARERPDIVFHAAALKQVPLVEAFPCEGVLTNVGGMRNVVDAATEAGADVVFVSTDKAVNPSGVMGASKRLGELYGQALDRLGGKRVLSVRLGNVLGSSGSVTTIFEEQIAKGGPLTVTDPEVTRFFLSIPQAADSLLNAAATGIGAESPRGAALVIDMGEALPVVDLARIIIALAGRRPDVDVPITFMGLRPGEKLHEQLVADDEKRATDPAPGVMASASCERGLPQLREIVARLTSLAREGEGVKLTAALFEAVASPVSNTETRRAAM